MRIAVLAHVRHPVAPPFMGGIEAHSWHLVRALRARGHDVTLFASGDSDPELRPVPVIRRHYEATFPWHEHRGSKPLTSYLDAAHAAVLERIAEGRFDVVHNNSLHRFPPRYAAAARQPTVTSLHVPPFDVLHRAIRDSEAPWHVQTAVTRAQLYRWWDRPPATSRVVANGIDLQDWTFRETGAGHAVWAGRIAANKAPGLATDAARRAGLRLTLYGVIEEPDHFQAEVAPRLGPDAVYGGHLDRLELARELGRGSVFLSTPVWDEPFGLAAVEALACGVPVAAFDSGAVREVVGESCGRYAATGDVEGLARAAIAALEIPREICRQRAEHRFSLDGMISAYERCYAMAVGARLDAFQPPSYAPPKLPSLPLTGSWAG